MDAFFFFFYQNNYNPVKNCVQSSASDLHVTGQREIGTLLTLKKKNLKIVFQYPYVTVMMVASALIVLLYIVARVMAHALGVVDVHNSQILYSGFAVLGAVSDVKKIYSNFDALPIFFFLFLFFEV